MREREREREVCARAGERGGKLDHFNFPGISSFHAAENRGREDAEGVGEVDFSKSSEVG